MRFARRGIEQGEAVRQVALFRFVGLLGPSAFTDWFQHPRQHSNTNYTHSEGAVHLSRIYGSKLNPGDVNTQFFEWRDS